MDDWRHFGDARTREAYWNYCVGFRRSDLQEGKTWGDEDVVDCTTLETLNSAGSPSMSKRKPNAGCD